MTRRTSLSILALEDRATPAAINFALTTATSILSLGGTLGTSTITAQGTNALTTTYSGTVRVDADFASNTLAFVGTGSTMTANNSGTWAPGINGATGSAAANYGGKVSVSGLPTNVAPRGLVSNFSSNPLSLTGVSFPSSQTLTLTSGSADYRNALLNGTESLAGNAGPNSAANGGFTDLGNGDYTLTMPCNATILDSVLGNTLTLNISGTLNATATLPVVDLNGAALGSDSSFAQVATGAGSLIAPAATVTRSTAANLVGMTVILAAHPDDAAESLAVNLTGTGLATSGYDALTGQLAITGIGTLAQYESALRKVSYTNASPNATPGSRPVTVSVADAANSSLVRTAGGTVTLPAAQVTAVQVNDGGMQRSRVTSLQVAFSKIVTFPPTPATAFSLARSANGAVVNLAASVDNGTGASVVTLTFTGGPLDGGSLADGKYTLTVLAAQVSGGSFDGNGDGTPGDNYILAGNSANKLYRFYGDSDGNASVDASDFAQFGNVFGTTVAGSAFDVDLNGSIDAADFAQFGARFGLTL